MFRCLLQGNEAELKDCLPRLQELDLTGNLLSSWHILQQIGNALPSLSMLNLSQNVLTPPDAAIMSSMPPNAALCTLVLNNCHLTWSQVSRSYLNTAFVTAAAPAAAATAAVDIRPASSTQATMHDWYAVRLLQVVSIQASVPNLQELHLCNNNIAALSTPDPSSCTFPRLQVQCMTTFRACQNFIY